MDFQFFEACMKEKSETSRDSDKIRLLFMGQHLVFITVSSVSILL